MIAGGFALARENGKIYLIKGAYPGEIVDVEVEKNKKDLSFCRIKRVNKASASRVIPLCKYFEKCGGCEWMNIKYEEQLKLKSDIFVDQMRHVAKIDINRPEIVPTKAYGYRNKMEMAVKNEELGFFKKSTHNFIKIEKCMLASDPLNMLKSTVEKVLKRHEKFASTVEHVVFREASGKTMVIFISSEKITPPRIESVDNVVTLENHSHVVVAGRQRIHKGSGILHINVNNVKYEIPAKAFFQVNYSGARELANIVKEYVGSGEKLLDLYCGVGFFSLQLSKMFEKVVGLESSPSSVQIARKNAKINGISNSQFMLLKVQDWKQKAHFDVVIVDPPRSGLERGVVEKIHALAPRKIIYVSCDITTFARDIKEFMKNGYVVEKVKLVDMFPQTHHVESVALIKKGECT